ncbi:MAG TPA: FAD-dependent oxidoreductase, partial [Opitutaceae bacterium]|nr:FAD-dependent oxidoreductase [Opitutaceae bacterium]
WKSQAAADYSSGVRTKTAIDNTSRTAWNFEPHVAETVFEDLVREHKIPVHRDQWLDRAKGVKKKGGRITSIKMLSGKTYDGKMFIDATYEGDLMAAAGVAYHVGR